MSNYSIQLNIECTMSKMNYMMMIPLFKSKNILPTSSNVLIGERIKDLFKSLILSYRSPLLVLITLDKAVEKDLENNYKLVKLYPKIGEGFSIDVPKTTGEANWKFLANPNLVISMGRVVVDNETSSSHPTYTLE